ncbi:MAG TPA: hypothetical protein VN436_03265, partial [Holophaga sp.]|nr:hypothetical protein [Holophaga sp.]
AGPASEGEALEALLSDRVCPECQGERLRAESRTVVVHGLRLPQVAALPLAEVRAWAEGLASPLAVNLRSDLLRRLQALEDAGLGYLTLDREIATLSGGEAQRLRLASALGGGLTGVAYMLDEPTQGLHPRDTRRLVEVLRGLSEAGNAVVVVEHDRDVVAQADHVIELGPGAGPEGGLVLAAGSPTELAARGGSRTAALLRREAGQPAASRKLEPGVTLRGASLHNLQDLDVAIPAGALVAVTGVSGSGKSSLVRGVLEPSLVSWNRGGGPVGCRELQVHAELQDVLALAQQGGPGGGASSVLTLAGLAEPLRKRFAATPEAKARKLTARHFSTASAGGRCEACEGRGYLTVAMDLMPDVQVVCEACGGSRFLPEVLACTVDGLTFPQVLEATVVEAAARFTQRGFEPLKALRDIGLGYLRLGQEARTLSGGELQRFRLAGLLAAPGGRAAVLLDEPARGLGFEDVDRLVAALRTLAGAGHLVVAVEHDLDLIASADWILDLGPEGGPGGGRLVAQGTPRDLAADPDSYTGRALAGRLTRAAPGLS